MSLERLPIGKNGMYKEIKSAKNGSLYRAKEFDPMTQSAVVTTVKVIDQDTVEYRTPVGPVILKGNQINSVLPARLYFSPRLGRRPFDLTWRPSK